MIYWQLFKLAITNVAGFVTKYWQFVLVAVLLITSFALYQKLDAVQFEYEQHLSADAKAMADRKLENYFKEKAHAKDIEGLVDAYNIKLEAIKHEYLKRTKKDSITIANLRRELRDKLAADTAIGLPEAPSNTEGNPEVWRNAYSAVVGQYDTLRSACAITTSDFNALRAWADSACQTVECK
jgi:hypothetical protein